MTAPTPLIADLMHQVEKRDAQIAELRRRLDEAERAWAQAVNEKRTLEEELMFLRRELGEEAA